VSVTSNERVRSPRQGAGNTEPDIEGADIGTDDRSVLLRAERAGTLIGRVYTLTYEAVDAAGNVSPPQSVTVTVAHDRRQRGR
jgi:hypothetical protein